MERARVDSYLDWVNTTAKPAFGEAIVKLKGNLTLGAVKETEESKPLIDGIYKVISHVNDQVAKEGGFLTGKDMSIADVSIYSICSTVIPVFELDISKYKAFTKWRAAIGKDEVIQALDAGMLERLQGSEDQNNKLDDGSANGETGGPFGNNKVKNLEKELKKVKKVKTASKKDNSCCIIF